MIGEIGAVANPAGVERVQRGNAEQAATRNEENQEVSQQSTADTATLSAEAVALAQNVAPPTESADTNVVEEEGRDPSSTPEEGGRPLDVYA